MKHLAHAVLGLILFSSAILIHEAGHLLTALYYGMPVEEFSIGFGPLLTQVEGWGLQWSLRTLPLGGYCKVEVPDDPSFPLFMMLSAGIVLNLAIGVAGILGPMRRGVDLGVDLGIPKSWREYRPFENTAGRIVYGVLSEIVFIFLFPLFAIRDLGVAALAGKGLLVWSVFHIVVGASNLLPILPILDGAKMGGVVMSSITGGDWGSSAFAVSLIFLAFLLLAPKLFVRMLTWRDKQKREKVQASLLTLHQTLVNEGWLVSFNYEWNDTLPGSGWVEFNAAKDNQHFKFSMPGHDMTEKNARSAINSGVGLMNTLSLSEMTAEVTMKNKSLHISLVAEGVSEE